MKPYVKEQKHAYIGIYRGSQYKVNLLEMTVYNASLYNGFVGFFAMFERNDYSQNFTFPMSLNISVAIFDSKKVYKNFSISKKNIIIKWPSSHLSYPVDLGSYRVEMDGNIQFQAYYHGFTDSLNGIHPSFYTLDPSFMTSVLHLKNIYCLLSFFIFLWVFPRMFYSPIITKISILLCGISFLSTNPFSVFRDNAIFISLLFTFSHYLIFEYFSRLHSEKYSFVSSIFILIYLIPLFITNYIRLSTGNNPLVCMDRLQMDFPLVIPYYALIPLIYQFISLLIIIRFLFSYHSVNVINVCIYFVFIISTQAFSLLYRIGIKVIQGLKQYQIDFIEYSVEIIISIAMSVIVENNSIFNEYYDERMTLDIDTFPHSHLLVEIEE